MNILQKLEAMRVKEKEKHRGGAYTIEESVRRPTSGAEAEWVLDSGSSVCVCSDPNLMWDIEVSSHPFELDQLKGEVKVYMEGTMKLTTFDKDNKPVDLVLKEVIYVPESKVNIFTVPST